MGVSGALARLALRHAHLLVIEVPGYWLTRVAVERLAGVRGWRLAVSPADADILAVCGSPGPELALVVARLWEQLPGPRARIDVAAPDLVAAALDQAEAMLRDTPRQRRDSTARDGQGLDDAPGGDIALAHGSEDRDGLEMDVLQVRLGPVLPDWPAGLVLRAHLHGDLIVEAQAGVVDAGQGGPAGGGHVVGGDTSGDIRQVDAGEVAARRCDNAARLLALAGWPDAAGGARAIRDRLLTGDRSAAITELARLRRRVRRSWLLRWSLRRVGPLPPDELARLGLAPDLTGDVWDRLNGMLDRAVFVTGGPAGVAAGGPAGAGVGGPTGFDVGGSVTPPAAVASVVSGWDVATARLIVASLDIAALDVVTDG
ncbi:hypothetical protein [Salinispora cortesiana]|uniref:hypothetical protein n=1 Tax=Salinispora cortesiana TaxID=1305843 RepID=UPI00040752C0|nr:hypothetical protein [Salinispora cortesiana]